MLAAQGAAGVSARGKGDVQGMGMKIKDQHLWDGECEITVGALLALTDDDKRRVKIDGKPMRVKDAYRSHAEHVVSDWGFFGHCDMTGAFHSPKSDDGGEPCLVWIDTKEAQAARADDPKTVELKANEFSDMCINAERYAIGRGNHVSVERALHREARGIARRPGEVRHRPRHQVRAPDVRALRQDRRRAFGVGRRMGRRLGRVVRRARTGRYRGLFVNFY